MKKWSLLILAALLLMPIGGQAEDLPVFLTAVSQGLSEGLQEGAAAVQASVQANQELTLTLAGSDTRIEEGRTLLLTMTVGNPYPEKKDVSLSLDLPERLACAQPLTWDAQLEAAAVDPASGALVPSTATFTREVTLKAGGGSEQATLRAELAMGTRFYRAETALDLCVPHITASAALEGADNQTAQAGDAFLYQIDVANDGTAPKDVSVSLLLPDGVSPDGALPTGFALRGRTIAGAVRAEAAGSCVIRLPMRIDEDALDGDADASRLLCGVLTVDGARIPMPLLKAVGPQIQAKLTAQAGSLQEGETMDLILTVANMGLAPADVQVSCRLPEGLTLMRDLTKAPAAPAQDTETSEATEEVTEDEAAENDEDAEAVGEDGDAQETDEDEPAPVLPAGDNLPPASGAAQRVMADARPEPDIREADGLITLDLRMDAARETGSGVAAATQEVALRVRADIPMDDVSDRLLGASLAWTTDGGDAQLGEAVALQVLSPSMFGLSHSEWNGVLLAALLMLITVCCLYSAVRSESKTEDYCFE